MNNVDITIAVFAIIEMANTNKNKNVIQFISNTLKKDGIVLDAEAVCAALTHTTCFNSVATIAPMHNVDSTKYSV